MRSCEFLKITIADKIAQVCLNRPDKANAFHEPMWEEIRESFRELDQSPGLRAIVIRGEGKHFCSGIDLSLLESLTADLPSDPGRRSEALHRKILHFQQPFNQIEQCRQPVIAQIHGACIGGALDLIAACDLRFCTEDSQFSIREIDMGLVADVGTLQRLPKLLNQGILRELAYTGRTVTGKEAERIGLVNRCFSDAETLDREVQNIATTIARKSPLAIRNSKQMLLYARDHSVEENLRYIAQLNSTMLLSEDLKNSVRGFLEKKTIEYKD